VEITFWYSTAEHLKYRSNDGLFYYVFNELINKRGIRIVSDGLSSLQAGEGTGLHHFKIKLGLEARPVCRCFYIHPIVRPLINIYTLRFLEATLRLTGRSRRFRKMIGVINIILGKDIDRKD